MARTLGQAEQQFTQGGFDPLAQEVVSTPPRGFVADIGAGLANGITDPFRSLFNLVNVESWTGIDDVDRPIFQDVGPVGSILGGVVQFAIPYGALTFGLKAAAGASKGGRIVQWLSGAKGASTTKALLDARKAGKASTGLVRALAGPASVVGRSAVKGAFIDGLVFEGAEGRLSDLIQQYDNLQNPVTEYLSAQEGDTELEGRFKNVLEGLLLGGMVDTIFAWRRGFKASADVVAAGGSKEAADTAFVKAADEGLEFKAELELNKVDAEIAKTAADITETVVDGETISFTGATSTKFFDDFVKGVGDLAGDTLDEDVAAKGSVSLPKTDSADLADRSKRFRKNNNASRNRRKREIERQRKEANGGTLTDVEIRSRRTDQIKEEAFLAGPDSDPNTGLRLDSPDVSQADKIRVQGVSRELQRPIDAKLNVNPRKLTAQERVQAFLNENDANLRMYYEDDSAAVKIQRALSRIGEGPDRTVVTNASSAASALEQAGVLSRMTKAEQRNAVLALGESSAGDVVRASHQAVALKMIMEHLGEKIFPAVKAVADDPSMTLNQSVQAASQLKKLLEIGFSQGRITSELGRGLQMQSIGISAKQINAGMKQEFTFEPLEALINMTDESFDASKVKIVLDDLVGLNGSGDVADNLRATMEWADKPKHQKLSEGTVEMLINNLLSGPTTHVVNFGSGLAMSFIEPFEKLLGNIPGLLSGDDAVRMVSQDLAKTEWKTITNLFSEFTEAWKMSKQSGGTAFDGSSKLELSARSSLSRLAQDSDYPRLFSPVASAIRIPSKALNSADTFMRVWNGRARAKAVLEVDLMRSGKVDPSEMEGRVTEMLKQSMAKRSNLKEQVELTKRLRDVGGEAEGAQDLVSTVAKAKELLNFNNSELDAIVSAQEQGILAGKKATWTEDLSEGFFGITGKAAGAVTKKLPLMKMFLPFIRTPVNIAEFGWDRSVGAVLGGSVEALRSVSGMLGYKVARTEDSMLRLSRDLASTDPRTVASARTRMASGLGVVGSITAATAMMDEDGLPILTGSGPSDPDVARTLKAAGWQPFSIKVNGSYVSYQRLDPFATLLGIVADTSEYIRENADGTLSGAATSALHGTASAVAHNITSKTYAQGLSDLLDLVTDPDRNAERVIGGVVSNFVPFSTFTSQVERTVDPTLTEIRSWTDRLRSRIPGFSAGMAPRRDLLGQVISAEGSEFALINPLRISKVKDSVVEKELSRFAYGFSEPVTTKAGVDLLDEEFDLNGQQAYDRYLELYGTVKVRGADIRQSLRHTIESAEYQRLDPDKSPDGDYSVRIDMLNAVIRKHRSRAWKELQRENSSLRSAIRETSQAREARRRGAPLTL